MDKTKPVSLAGMTMGGHSKNGESVMFEFQTHAGKTLKFLCPYEAIGEMVAKLTHLAERATNVRGNADREKYSGEAKFPLRTQAIDDWAISASENGFGLMLQCGPLQYQFGLTPEQCDRISEGLGQAPQERTKHFPTH